MSFTPDPSFSAIHRLQNQPRIIKALGFLVLFTIVAVLDLVLDPDLSLFVLYLIPTLYAAWFLGTRWGHASCLACAVIWVVDDWGGSVFYNHPLISYWNLTGKLIVLMVIVAIVSTLKGALEEEYEAERRWVQREFEIAREVQMRLLPARPPVYPRLDLCFLCQPAQVVGGTTMTLFHSAQDVSDLPLGMFPGRASPARFLWPLCKD